MFWMNHINHRLLFGWIYFLSLGYSWGYIFSVVFYFFLAFSVKKYCDFVSSNKQSFGTKWQEHASCHASTPTCPWKPSPSITSHTYHRSTDRSICPDLLGFSQLPSCPGWSGPALPQSAPAALDDGRWDHRGWSFRGLKYEDKIKTQQQFP